MRYFGAIASVLALAAVVIVTLVARDPANDADGGAADTASLEIDYATELADARGPLADLYADGAEVVETDDPVAELERQLAELRGTPVVVNEWGSWCGPCRAEFPSFQRVSADRGERIAFLGVDSDELSVEAAENFLADFPVPYPSIYDSQQEIRREVWGLRSGLPATIFYDERGRRVFTHQGPYLTPEELEADIDRHLGSG